MYPAAPGLALLGDSLIRVARINGGAYAELYGCFWISSIFWPMARRRAYESGLAIADRHLNQAKRSVKMIESRIGFWRRTGGMLVAAGLLALSGAALATEQSQQRQQGRDANQAAKQDARSGKVDCRAENNKSNAECRQDKRDTKQEGRQEKREIKY